MPLLTWFRSISGEDPTRTSEVPAKELRHRRPGCLSAGLLILMLCTSVHADEPVHAPSGDSARVLETFDAYSNQVGEFPNTWGAQSGWRRAKEEDIYYALESEDGNIFLRAQTTGKAVNAATGANVNLRIYNRFRWRWRAFSLPVGGNEEDKKLSDSGAAVRLVFHGGIIPKMLTYVWSATLPAGTETVSPNTDKVKIIVLESGSSKLGEWVWEEVDAYGDYKRLYGGEPRLVKYVAVITDSDNTNTFVMADYDDFSFVKAPPDTLEMVPDFLETQP